MGSDISVEFDEATATLTVRETVVLTDTMLEAALANGWSIQSVLEANLGASSERAVRSVIEDYR